MAPHGTAFTATVFVGTSCGLKQSMHCKQELRKQARVLQRHAVSLDWGVEGYLSHLHFRVATPIDDPGVLHCLLQYTEGVVQTPLSLI